MEEDGKDGFCIGWVWGCCVYLFGVSLKVNKRFFNVCKLVKVKYI